MSDTAPAAAPPDTAATAAPVTPPRDRTRRKAKSSSPPATTPTKKLKSSTVSCVKSDTSSSTQSPSTMKSSYVYLSASTTSLEIASMGVENLINEVVKNQVPSDDILTVSQAQQMNMEQLRQHVTVIHAVMKKQVKKTTKKLKSQSSNIILLIPWLSPCPRTLHKQRMCHA